MSKSSSSKYYQDNKEILQKRLIKDIEVFIKKKKKETICNIVVNDAKIPLKIKNKRNHLFIRNVRVKN